jgi:type I restriction enzyme S subunit
MKRPAQPVRWVRLGDYVQRIDSRNSENSVKTVKSVSVTKEFKDTNAKVDKTNLDGYKVVNPGEISFVQTTGNEKCLCIAVNHFADPIVVTSVNEVFKTDESQLFADYLYIWWRRKEADRYARFHSWGSARETFDWNDMCRVRIPLPDIDEQRRIVAAWRGLRNIKEQNEALAEPLLALCQSRLEELKKRATAGDESVDWVALGEYIQPCDERNDDLSVKLSQGIANFKEFQNPKQVAANSRADRIVRTGDFAYNRATTRNGEKISIAYREGPDCTVSGAYQVFRIAKPEFLESMFLLLWFKRPEFDRYARYMSKGSAHEFFEYDDMSRVRIPLPRIEEQKRIVAIYEAAREAKRIAEEAGKLSEAICPALIRRAAEAAT